ncbi:DDE superfamily endonuclease, CENP-B-like protein [Purpureocillium lavendulum]|uniref:DDE superfamily endonuclease, CENP-B-like protein n=1 Tax=Purpureocillium lavendulum TaxID=1247861 RepID=A0AB34FCK4_9HYPO|nr:DDE superfamily endonuclease, CENP-B-like protein [Purpureocillium lavendulum]
MATNVQIPGLNSSLTDADMERSRQLYNSLPSDKVQPEVEHLLEQLAEIFVRNNAHKVFGVHLIHGHLQIPEKKVLFGEKRDPCCRWTKPTNVDSLNLASLRGHIFLLTDKGFHPYEYDSGQHPDLVDVEDNFVAELADFLRTKRLSRVIALEVLENPLPETMMELVLGDYGTMMMTPEHLRGCTPFRQTGWAFVAEDGGPRVCKDGKQHHVTGPNGHIIIVEPPKNTKIDTCSDALHIMKEYGLLN